MNYSATPFNLQYVLKMITQALHKNYLYNQDKYRYAKSITNSYLSWLNYSLSENIISRAYMLYNKPLKVKTLLSFFSVFLKKNGHFILGTFHKATIVGVSIGIYYVGFQIYEYLKVLDDILVDIIFFNSKSKLKIRKLL